MIHVQHPNFESFTTHPLQENVGRFQNLKSDNPPLLGRRARKLALSREFWALSLEERRRLSKVANDPSNVEAISTALTTIDDEKDESDTTLGVGLVLRTDYSNNDAWTKFCDALRDAEKESLGEEDDADMEENNADENDGDSDSDSDSEDDGKAQPLFVLKSDPSLNLAGISNIAALRLFNDVDIGPAPKKPADTSHSKVKVSHPLMDKDGLVEAYKGNLLWIYDAKSNTDGSVRVVNQNCETHGIATGDSWRARAPFLPGLQVNLFGGGMKITFTGLDGWDQDERNRNLEEGNLA